MKEYNIGAKVRKLRVARKLTLQSVARETGFSTALISQIENDNVSPPIATLSRLSKFFDVKIGTFFADDADCPFEVVRKGEQKQVNRLISPAGTGSEYNYESLSFRKQNKKMEPFLLTVSGNGNGEGGCCHEGEEFLIIVEGTAELLIEGELVLLEEGDSVYLNSNLRHRLLPKDGSEVKAIAVVTR
jgi:transcriptional regulator with XRE-family HTH domain